MEPVQDYIAQRIRRPVPLGCSVIPGSTPVVSFGNVQVARTATLGLNPSLREFADNKGGWLTGEKRRLATTQSLGLDDLTHASDEQVAAVVADCNDYFDRNPYGWFNALEQVMQGAVGTSYHDGSACHLDLVQWATDPVWQKLASPVRTRLIAEDREFLRQQLQWEQIRLVLLNGRTVVDQVKSMGIPLEKREPAVAGSHNCQIVLGEAYGTTFLGWSANLQSGFVSKDLKKAITARVRSEAEDVAAASATLSAPPVSYVPRGTVVRSKLELTQVLRAWLARSDAKTIGDVGTFGGKAWLALQLDGTRVVLNADTRRAAVQDYLEYVSETGPDAPWHVAMNQAGTVNKVLYREDVGLPGWYCYVSTPWAAAGTL